MRYWFEYRLHSKNSAPNLYFTGGDCAPVHAKNYKTALKRVKKFLEVKIKQPYIHNRFIIVGSVRLCDPNSIYWNPYNLVVQDHRDGSINIEKTNYERMKRNLPIPWTSELAESEAKKLKSFISWKYEYSK